MNVTKFAQILKKKAKTESKLQRAGTRVKVRPERFRCYNVILSFDYLASQIWHMSISNVFPPSDSDKADFDRLLEALDVPPGNREGRVVAKQTLDGKGLPEVRHFMWPIAAAELRAESN
jgi:hypothetical protein